MLLALAARSRPRAGARGSAWRRRRAIAAAEVVEVGPLSRDAADALMPRRRVDRAGAPVRRERRQPVLSRGARAGRVGGAGGARPPAAPGVPRAVMAALADEIATLDAEARLVAQAGAVAGDPFDPAIAAAAAASTTRSRWRRWTRCWPPTSCARRSTRGGFASAIRSSAARSTSPRAAAGGSPRTRGRPTRWPRAGPRRPSERTTSSGRRTPAIWTRSTLLARRRRADGAVGAGDRRGLVRGGAAAAAERDRARRAAAGAAARPGRGAGVRREGGRGARRAAPRARRCCPPTRRSRRAGVAVALAELEAIWTQEPEAARRLLEAERAALGDVRAGPAAELTLAMATERNEYGDFAAVRVLAEQARRGARAAGDRPLEALAAAHGRRRGAVRAARRRPGRASRPSTARSPRRAR